MNKTIEEAFNNLKKYDDIDIARYDKNVESSQSKDLSLYENEDYYANNLKVIEDYIKNNEKECLTDFEKAVIMDIKHNYGENLSEIFEEEYANGGGYDADWINDVVFSNIMIKLFNEKEINRIHDEAVKEAFKMFTLKPVDKINYDNYQDALYKIYFKYLKLLPVAKIK